MKTAYVANLSYGEPSLVRVSVITETEKSWTISSDKEVLFGWGSCPKRLLKSNYSLFYNKKSAINYLEFRALEYRDSLLTKIDAIETTIVFLEGLKNELE